MTYLIGKEIHGEKSGLVASSVLAVTLGFSTYAHFAYMDIPMLLLVSLTFYYSLLFLKTNKTKLLYLTCILGGLTVSTKYNSGLVVILIFIVCHLHRSIILYRKNCFSFGFFCFRWFDCNCFFCRNAICNLRFPYVYFYLN